MDMALRDAPRLVATGSRAGGVGCPSRRASATLGEAAGAAMMMAMVWPTIVTMPFFWAPPFWVLAGMSAARAK